MSAEATIEFFLLKCASLKIAVDRASTPYAEIPADVRAAREEASPAPFISQFSTEMRREAEEMAQYYKLFHMLENDIRRLIDETLTEAYGADWWDSHTPQSTKDECRANQQRERDAGVTSRSDDPLDYISFGQLGDIIRENWTQFGGILSNQKALGRTLFGLNMLRGPKAHCGTLAEDEVARLESTVKDWFRLLEGPK
jgi:hypothetical protein